MKHTVISFCLSLMLTQASPSRKMNDREHEGFKGPVRKVFVERSSQTEVGNAPVGARCPEETQNYDQQGRLISHLLYPGVCGEDGEARETYSYDKDENRLGRQDDRKASGIPISSPNPPMPSDRKNQNSSYSTKRVLKHDSKGRISEESVYSPSGQLIDKTIYKYDSQNRLIEWESVDDAGSISEKQTFIYNGDERFPSGSIGIGSDGKPDSRETYSDYEVNSRGDWIKRREILEHLDQPNQAKTIRIIIRTIDYY
jgi:hypothetical protein